MRLWHKELIPVLPRQQLVSQWRECLAVSGMMIKDENHIPNMLLVAKVAKYPLAHFVVYAQLVAAEMQRRGYKISDAASEKWLERLEELGGVDWELYEYLRTNNDVIFSGWHNDRYFRQCYFNLEEKYDCGGISEEEFKSIRALAIEKQTL